MVVEYIGSEVAMLLPITVSALFGSLIGIERELRHKPAGIGTNILICSGACIFALISARVDPGSPSRIASNILTGVGFIGAGLILKETDGSVRGLTTAAGIWMAAAIGMAIGYSFYLVAAAGTLFAIFSPRFPGWLHQHGLEGASTDPAPPHHEHHAIDHPIVQQNQNHPVASSPIVDVKQTAVVPAPKAMPPPLAPLQVTNGGAVLRKRVTPHVARNVRERNHRR